MNPFFQFLSKKEIRIFILCTGTGAILQILSKRYLKNHPEYLKNSPEPEAIKIVPPGGADIVVNPIVAAVLRFLAEHGLTAGAISSVLGIIAAVPTTALSTCLRDALPQHLLKDKKFVLANGNKIYLDNCDENLSYLFDILLSDKIPFDEKRKKAYASLTNYLDLKTLAGRRNFILCVVVIFYILATKDLSSFYVMMQSLIKAVREGRISKAMARIIIRRLRKKGLPVDPELVELAGE